MLLSASPPSWHGQVELVSCSNIQSSVSNRVLAPYFLVGGVLLAWLSVIDPQRILFYFFLHRGNHFICICLTPYSIFFQHPTWCNPQWCCHREFGTAKWHLSDLDLQHPIRNIHWSHPSRQYWFDCAVRTFHCEPWMCVFQLTLLIGCLGFKLGIASTACTNATSRMSYCYVIIQHPTDVSYASFLWSDCRN